MLVKMGYNIIYFKMCPSPFNYLMVFKLCIIFTSCTVPSVSSVITRELYLLRNYVSCTNTFVANQQACTHVTKIILKIFFSPRIMVTSLRCIIHTRIKSHYHKILLRHYWSLPSRKIIISFFQPSGDLNSKNANKQIVCWKSKMCSVPVALSHCVFVFIPSELFIFLKVRSPR